MKTRRLLCGPLLLAALTAVAAAPAPQPPREAARIIITCDEWGIAHVRGKSDADAVFGAIYGERYASGDLRPVHFYTQDIAAHAVRSYRPGER